RSLVNSSSPAMCRRLMPVRVVIHSSDVSIIRSRSELLRMLGGAYAPRSVTPARVRPFDPRSPVMGSGPCGYLPTVVTAALWADDVRRLHLLSLGTGHQGGSLKGVVAAT